MVAVPFDSPIKSARDMKGKDLRFGVSSESIAALAMLTGSLEMGIRPIPYDGSGDMVLAAIRGDVDAFIVGWPTAIKGVRESDGKLASLFVVSDARPASIPEVPTIAESGVSPDPDLYAVTGITRVLAAPPGVDPQVEQMLVTAIRKTLADPEYVRQVVNAGYEVIPASAAEVRMKLRSAIEQFRAAKPLIEGALK
jgi:tripartite-type tricarboxylate transporter receptor subunit TctC